MTKEKSSHVSVTISTFFELKNKVPYMYLLNCILVP